MNNKNKESYSKEEAERRFDAALRGAFATPPKPMKDIPRKRSKQKRKLKAKASASPQQHRGTVESKIRRYPSIQKAIDALVGEEILSREKIYVYSPPSELSRETESRRASGSRDKKDK
jgi:hypothetical protein